MQCHYHIDTFKNCILLNKLFLMILLYYLGMQGKEVTQHFDKEGQRCKEDQSWC